jgi:rhodanese-related sulfurtransferase
MKSKILILLSFLAISCKGQTAQDYKTIPAKTFAELIKTTPNAQILDVRSPEEFAGQHIDNAVNVNWNDDNFEANASKYNKSKPVFVYCMSGGRSAKASAKLQELGFATIYNLDGGILKWNSAGLDTPSDKIIGVCPQEYAELLKSDKKVLIDFYADWCEPCQKMKPYLLQMQKDLADRVVIIRLNADENKTMMKELKIDQLPALLLYENKQLIWQHAGFISQEDLITKL